MVNVAQYLQAASVIRDYEGDLYISGRDAARQLVAEIQMGPSFRDPILPRLAVVLFTQADDGDGADGTASEPLRRLCAGINEGLGNCGDSCETVPVIGCSVASIPDLMRQETHVRAFSITLLAARRRDFTACVGGSDGFVNEEDGHQKAWTQCLCEIEQQAIALGGEIRPLPDDGFVLAVFPGRVAGATDFKARNLASYRWLRGHVSADLPILGAGAGELGRQLLCHVMAGRELISQGYACARVHTTLRFKISMEHDLRMASEILLVKKLREGEHGKQIVSFAVPPAYETVPARDVLTQLQATYQTSRFVFRTVEFSDEQESLLFQSINPGDESVDLAGPVHVGTLIRPAFVDREQPIFRRGLARRLPENAPVAAFFSFICYGMLRLLGDMDREQRAAAMTRLQQAVDAGIPNCVQVSGFVFGEWGPGTDLNAQAGYYHSTTLALSDALTPRHHQRRQIEILEQCSNAMHTALRHAEEQAEEQKEQLTTRGAAAVLAGPLFEAVVDLGYDGGLISLVNEVDQTIFGAEAHGEAWLRRKETMVVALDADDAVARVYRDAAHRPAERCLANGDPSTSGCEQPGAAAARELPLWSGSRCLGVLEVGHGARLAQDGEEDVLSKLARRMAEHLGSVKSQETIHDLEEAVRSAIACDDQEEGWSRFAQVAARVVEVPFCAIRTLDSTGKFLKLVGGSRELVELTRKAERALTQIEQGVGPMAAWFRQFLEESRQHQPAAGVGVVQDATEDEHLRAIGGAVPELYARIRSYALGALLVPQRGLQGMIAFLSYRPNFFNPERQDLVRKAAGYAAIIAKVYKSTLSEQAMLKTTLSLATIQTRVDPILRAAREAGPGYGQEVDQGARHERYVKEAAKLLVAETLKILPCEACALHRFEARRYLVLQAAAPDESIHDKTCWDVFEPKDHGFMMYLATQVEIYRAAGEEVRSHNRIREKTRRWNWLPTTGLLHSILAIPLVDPDGRHYGLLTLFNQLNEQGRPGDELDFNSVHTRLRAFLQEIATNVLESLEASRRLARLADLAQQLQLHAERFMHSTDHVDVDSVLCDVAASLAQWLEAEICSIYLVKQPERQLLLRGCYGWNSGRNMLRRAYYRMGEGLTGMLAEEDEPRIIPSIFVDTRRTGKYFQEMYGPPDPTRTYEMIALPLRYGNEPLGIITLYRKLPRELAQLLSFGSRDIVSFKLAAHLASLAIAVISGAPPTEEAIEAERPAMAEILSVAGRERQRELDYNLLAERIMERFRARLCGIFLSPNQDRTCVVLRGANGPLKKYAGTRIERHAGPVGHAFATQVTQFLDLPEQLAYIGPLDQTLRECLEAPLENLVAAPMRLGEECEGVILLVNRAPLALNEQRAKSLVRYHLEALGTGILLVRRSIDYELLLQSFKKAITEQTDAALTASAAEAMAHQLGKPVRELIDKVDAMNKARKVGATREDSLDVIYEGVGRINQALSKTSRSMQQANLERLDLDVVVSEAIEPNGLAARDKNVRIVTEIAPRSFVRGHPIHLVYVISTIIENAIEACESRSGLVRIAAEPSPEQGMVRLVIEDNGRGIPPEDYRRVFLREFSTKQGVNHEERRGYGLHFAKIMQLMQGGDIEVDGSMPTGTRMVVWLPGDSDAQSTAH